MKQIETQQAPKPAGHYAQAVEHQGWIYISGQLPIAPDQPVPSPSGMSIQQQTDQVLSNLRAILEAAGSSIDLVIRTTVYISDIRLWGDVNEVYARFFKEHRPARTVVPTLSLHYGFSIEMDAVAILPDYET